MSNLKQFEEFDKSFDEKFYRNEKRVWISLDGESYDSIIPEMGRGELLKFFHSELEKQKTKLLCEFQDTEMKWKRQLEEAKQEQIEECLKIINHSIDKQDAYFEINQKLKD